MPRDHEDDNSGPDPDSHFVFLVRRGDIRIWKDAQYLKVELSEGDGRSCLLTLQDAIDLSSLLTQLALQMFGDYGVPSDWKQQVVQDDINSFVWTLGAEQCRIFYREEESEYLQISYTGMAPAAFSVGHVSELAQVLGTFVRRVHDGPQ
jgi:hypothetical protein